MAGGSEPTLDGVRLPPLGVQPLRQAYRHLLDRLNIDAVVLVDGGTDILLRGDESTLGTPVEDITSVAAVAGLDVQVKLVTCLGFGIDAHDGVNHVQVLENIAALDRDGGYLGALSIPGGSREAALYRDAVAAAQSATPEWDLSRPAAHYMSAGRPAVAAIAPSSDPDATDFWRNVCFATEDCDRNAKRIVEAGGTLLQAPMDVMDKGRMAIAKDPVGAQFGLWQGLARRSCAGPTATRSAGSWGDPDAVTPSWGTLFVVPPSSRRTSER